MTNFARIKNNVAIDVSTDPHNHFHPDLAAEFEPVPADVQNGWVLSDGQWAAPAPVVIVPAVGDTLPTPVEFMLLFTSAERVAIKAQRATDPVIDDFFDIAEDPRLTVIRLSARTTVEAVNYFAQQGLIAVERVAVILAGVSPA